MLALLVHERDVRRGLAVEQDVAQEHLEVGEQELLGGHQDQRPVDTQLYAVPLDLAGQEWGVGVGR